jgi:hypothetical protein
MLRLLNVRLTHVGCYQSMSVASMRHAVSRTRSRATISRAFQTRNILNAIRRSVLYQHHQPMPAVHLVSVTMLLLISVIPCFMEHLTLRVCALKISVFQLEHVAHQLETVQTLLKSNVLAPGTLELTARDICAQFLSQLIHAARKDSVSIIMYHSAPARTESTMGKRQIANKSTVLVQVDRAARLKEGVVSSNNIHAMASSYSMKHVIPTSVHNQWIRVAFLDNATPTTVRTAQVKKVSIMILYVKTLTVLAHMDRAARLKEDALKYNSMHALVCSHSMEHVIPMSVNNLRSQ